MIQIHTGGLQTVIPLLIRGITSILHTFSNLSAPSMKEFFKTLIIYLNWLSRWYSSYRRTVNSYPPTYPGVKSILHTFSILSAPSMIEFFKTFINCLNWLSRWYRCIQADCKQLSPCLSWVSHQYCTYFQIYQRHLWLNFLKLW